MLPDFPIAVTGVGDRPRILLARDVSVAAFFYGFPNAPPATDCWRQDSPEGKQRTNWQMEAWVDGLLTRVVVRPRLTLELVHRLGAGRDVAAVSYLQTIGWIERTPDAPSPIGETLVSAHVNAELLEGGGAILQPVVTIPEPNIRKAIRVIARKGHVLPSVVWALAISEFIFNWKVLLKDDLLAGGGMAPQGDILFTNDSSLLEQLNV